MGLLSGRSRHIGRNSRSERDLKISSRQKEEGPDEETVEVKQPELDELRRRRTSYYSITPAERRKSSALSTHKRTSGRSVTSSSRTAEPTRKRRPTKRKSSTVKPKESEKQTDDYVYGKKSFEKLTTAKLEASEEEHAQPSSPPKISRYSNLSRRHSLPTVFESEITPDDSISQVAERTETEKLRRRVSVRPSLKRSNTTSSKLSAVPEIIEDTPVITPTKRPSKAKSIARGSTARRHSTTSIPSPPRLVECLTCGSDDVPSAQSAKLACGHRMCHECLKRIFELSAKDPTHMPPKCCTNQHIPLKHVDNLFDIKFKTMWNRKYQEYHTKNRVYCPTLKCGEWIKPSHIHTLQGRKYAHCPRCRTKVCILCNNKMHKSTDCPKDPEIAKLVEQAKDEGWQRCYSCNAMVERREGCNHMTCRCLAEFCILCGCKWKTCDCPWFNYAHLPDPDRLNNMRIPEPIQVFVRQFVGGAANRPPPPPRPHVEVAEGTAAPVANARRGPPPEVTYQQELDQRRRQERLDADLARRLQLASLFEPNDAANLHPLGPMNAANNVANNDIAQGLVRDATILARNALADPGFNWRDQRPSPRRRRMRQAEQNDNVGVN